MRDGGTLPTPRNLTHCGNCDRPFPEPVTWWDEHFNEVEDASYWCKPCGEAEGLPSESVDE